MTHFSSSLLALAALAVNSYAVETRFWQQTDQSDFEKGSRKSVSLRSDGLLTLAPSVTEFFDSSTPYLFAAARDSKGNLYAGGGGSEDGSARVFLIDASGHGRVLADLPGISIQAIAIDGHDNVFAATSPEGKVYRLAPGGKSSVFFDPQARYIWALSFAAKDDALYVATGDPGRIFRVTPDGKSSVYFKTDETNVRSLAFEARGSLIAGTEPGGLVLRVTPSADKSTATGFVLYQTAKTEVSSVSIGPDGSIYAAAVGTRGSSVPAPLPSPSTSTPVTPVPSASTPGRPASPAQHLPPTIAGGSEVYRIAPDGSPLRIWTDPQAVVYSIAFDSSGKPLLGTGNRGNLYRVDSPILSTLVTGLAPTQITALVPGPSGSLFAVTGNIGRVYRIGPGLAAHGTFESDAYDAGSFSYWGNVSLRPAPSAVSLETRSGNLDRPQQNWSDWKAVPFSGDTGRSSSPPARFLQYRLTLKPLASGLSPSVSSVTAAYLPKNAAPELQEMEITEPNYRFLPQPALLSTPSNLNLPPLGAHKSASPPVAFDLGAPASMTYAKGFLGVRWNASDPNGDTLVYKLEIRGVNDSLWRPLKDKIREKSFSWDSAAFPDGDYVLRLTASDELSNPPAGALGADLLSDPFTIDNTPPSIVEQSVAPEGARAILHCKVRDSGSIIAKSEYSIDGGDWLILEPTSKLSDAREEEYSLPIERPASGERVVALRVTDDYDNQTVVKFVVK